MSGIRPAALTAIIIGSRRIGCRAHSNVTQADIQRLQDNVYQAGTRRLTAPQPRRRARQPASGGARRASRRSDLSEGEASQGTVAGAQRVRRRARSHRGSPHACARRRRQRLYASSGRSPASRRRRRLDSAVAFARTTTHADNARFRPAPRSTSGCRTRLNSGTARSRIASRPRRSSIST